MELLKEYQKEGELATHLAFLKENYLEIQ
jgi:hypothetical protein